METRQMVMKYHEAWTAGDMEAARSCLADDLQFQGSIESFHNADDFVAALTMFRKMLRGVTLIQSLFSESGAALLYDCETAGPAGTIRSAEFFSVKEGKISSINLVFDATELRKAMAG